MQHIRQDSISDLYVTANWNYLENHKSDKKYESADVLLVSDSRDSMKFHARIRTRGNMRLDICTRLPYKLKLDKGELKTYGLSAMNEVDIVEHCHASPQYDQYLLREYLAYKIWQLISPNAYEVELIRLHFTQSDGSEAYEPTYAFLLENTEELVARLGGRPNKTSVISNHAVDREPMLQVALFEFMIGNTDWYIFNRHNLEFVVLPDHPLLVPIPYDFDYSGLVDAPYAAHHTSINLSSVRIRYYQGWCFPEEEVKRALKVFREQKQAILKLPYEIPGLDQKSANYTHDYLVDFFDIIDNPRKLENQILKHCDMWPVKK